MGMDVWCAVEWCVGSRVGACGTLKRRWYHRLGRYLEQFFKYPSQIGRCVGEVYGRKCWWSCAKLVVSFVDCQGRWDS